MKVYALLRMRHSPRRGNRREGADPDKAVRLAIEKFIDPLSRQFDRNAILIDKAGLDMNKAKSAVCARKIHAGIDISGQAVKRLVVDEHRWHTVVASNVSDHSHHKSPLCLIFFICVHFSS